MLRVPNGHMPLGVPSTVLAPRRLDLGHLSELEREISVSREWADPPYLSVQVPFNLLIPNRISTKRSGVAF